LSILVRILLVHRWYKLQNLFANAQNDSLDMEEEPKNERIKWGDARVACSHHYDEILAMENQNWPLTRILAHLRRTHNVFLSYDTFRRAWLRIKGNKEKRMHVKTEPENLLDLRPNSEKQAETESKNTDTRRRHPRPISTGTAGKPFSYDPSA
jgi:hypothetical protein